MACIVIPALTDHYEATGDWQSFAWFIHDHLPYSEITLFTRLAALNIGWSTAPRRTIDSFISPTKGYLYRPDLFASKSSNAEKYDHVPLLRLAAERAKHLTPATGGYKEIGERRPVTGLALQSWNVQEKEAQTEPLACETELTFPSMHRGAQS